MSGSDELDEAIALANSGRSRPATPPAPRLKRIRRIQWADEQAEAAAHGERAEGTAHTDGASSSGARRQDRAHTSDSPEGPGRTEEAPTPTWEEARALAAGAVGALPPTKLPLDRARGHTLAAALEALTDLPSFDTSAMDGWAVSGPGPWELARGADGAEAGGLLAGHRGEPRQLADGQAVRIATGARIPAGTSAVLRSEQAQLTAKGRLRTDSPPQPGTDIRPRGQECRKGDELLPAGAPVTPAVLGLAAAAGYDELEVVRRPRAEILVLGDELLHKGRPQDGRIRDALGPMVGPWLEAFGGDVIVTRRLGDDAEALYEAVATTTADVVVTTGGTAAGPVDHLQPTLRRLGAELLVRGVRVRPGHPMLLATLPGADPRGGAYLVGLPGNPLAALSGLVTLAVPLLRTLAGLPERAVPQATLGEEVAGHPHDTRLVPVVREGSGIRARIRPLRYAGPAMLRGIASADALAAVPPGGAAPGTDVPVLDLPW
ncbi:molybdopterin molybdotransferase MoeA [Streptomyces iconiensis]|uniref:Molybdopterin molybdenumtransferase n=1 Tax=Streptomyces iconiensis TaxID=1384038 RepID=A0ABT6ZRD0_9ACTN|nr:molybdopterin molybdotransferase MoeA [Streptomyces iconiensis]MDJ1131594.1 molybdopterin molybdotransferase MoeA [Streptomyces iconiensis]